MTTKAQQIALDNALVALENQRVIRKCNMRINPRLKPKEPTYQVVLDALALTTCYPAFLITTDVLVIYMQQYVIRFLVKNLTHLHLKRKLNPLSENLVILERSSTSLINDESSHAGLYLMNYYAIATWVEPLKLKKTQKKSDSAILSEENPSKKKPAKAKKDVPSINGLGDGTDKGTGTKLGVLDVPKYDSESEKESWGDSREDDDDDEDDSEDESDGDNNDDDGDSTDDDGDNNDDDGDNDDNDDDSNDERSESDRDENPNLNLSNVEHEDEEEEYVDERVHTPKNHELTDEEKIDDEEKMDKEEDDDVTKELYKDVNVNLGNKDTDKTNVDQGRADQHNVSQESRFEQLLNFKNASATDNTVASLMDTTIHHEEPNTLASSLFTIPITVIPKITSAFTITIPLPPLLFNPLPQQATPSPTPTASEVTTSFPELPDFSFVFKFNDRVTNLEKDLSEMKQVDQDEAQAKKREYINLIDTSVRAIIKEEVTTQLPCILPQAVSDFATLVIERNVTESLKADVLAKSSSQPKSTYAVAASLSEFELIKILMDKMEEHKSYLRVDYKRELYDALVKSYNIDKDLFELYGDVFTLKRSRDEKDKDQHPSTRSDQGTKIRKSSKDAESYRDPKSKESKS
ncbi:hypothetical protein Tco_1390080 [Tanacetum coccineum]